MSKLPLPKRSLYRTVELNPLTMDAAVVYTKRKKLAVAIKAVNAVNAASEVADGGGVNAQKKKTRSGSKHPPGYMTEYMRKRRAK